MKIEYINPYTGKEKELYFGVEVEYLTREEIKKRYGLDMNNQEWK